MRFDFKSLNDSAQLFHSPRIALRAFTHSDTWPLWSATREPLFNENLLWARPKDDVELYGRVRAIMRAMDEGKMAALSIVAKETGQWIGLMRLFGALTDKAPTVEFGLWTHPLFWRGGYGAEATKLIVDALMEDMAPPRAIARSASTNSGAHGVLTKCGFSLVNQERAESEQGRVLPTLVFELLQENHTAQYRSHPNYVEEAPALALAA